MSLPNELLPLGLLATPEVAEQITIERSLRFNSADTAYLNRTPASAGNRKKWTWAGWVKRSAFSSTQRIFCAGSGSSYTEILFISDTLKINTFNSGSDVGQLQTQAVFRDPSAWYHAVISFNAAGTSKIYVNGVEQSLTTITAISNIDHQINNTVTHRLGSYFSGADYLNAYLADVYFIDGQELGPTIFGEFDATTGVWVPIEYLGSYGTNGFHLPFSDNSSVSALGTDTSGNGNDWTVNNISVGDGTIYSTGFTASGGTFYGSSTAQDAFNGLASPYAVSLDTSTFQFAPTTSIPINTSLRVWYPPHGGFESTKTVTIDGVSSVLNPVPNSYYFHDCSALVGKTISTSTPLTITATGSRTQVSVTGIEVDGVLLTDAPLGDSLRDSPTNGDTANDTGAGGQVPGNYCTWNPLTKGTYTNGNLDSSNTTYQIGTGTIGVSSGKWYWEVAKTDSGTTHTIVGATPKAYSTAEYLGVASGEGFGIYFFNGNLINNGSGSGTYGAFSQGDILNVALDMDNGKVWFGKNGTWFNSGNPAAGTNALLTGLTGTYYPGVSNASGTVTCSANFGQRVFAYSAPSGFKALCTANLDDPTIEDGSAYMDVKLYTGNGSTQTISGFNFSPDFVWSKSRSNISNHYLFDTVRGATNRLESNTTQNESANSGLTQFNSDGYNIGADSSMNANNWTYVNWCWDAGSSTVSNTAGSITSQVRANASAGFSIVTWTGDNSTATIGHGLNANLGLVIVKNRSISSNWNVWFSGYSADEYLLLNLANAKNTFSGQWGSTPTSTVFGVGAFSSLNGNGNDLVAYCFAPVAGYSAFGSYNGTSSTDGPFIYTGFRPSFVMIKVTAGYGSEPWLILDSKRNAFNVTDNYLHPNNSAAEASLYYQLDLLSNGFKLRNASAASNATGASYIYAAFAENPFKYARAR